MAGPFLPGSCGLWASESPVSCLTLQGWHLLLSTQVTFGNRADVPTFFFSIALPSLLALFSIPHLTNDDSNSFLHMLRFSLNLWTAHLAEELAILSPCKFWQAFKCTLMRCFKSRPIPQCRAQESRAAGVVHMLEVSVRWGADSSRLPSLGRLPRRSAAPSFSLQAKLGG